MSSQDIPLTVQQLECADSPALKPRADAAEQQGTRPRIAAKTIWNLAIGVAGVSYLLTTLCLNVESPLFAGVLVAAAGYEIARSQLRRRRL